MVTFGMIYIGLGSSTQHYFFTYYCLGLTAKILLFSFTGM